MGFWDNINKFLKPPRNNPFGGHGSGGEGLHLSGINPLNTPVQYNNPRILNTSELAGIIQQRNSAFTQIVINPFQLSSQNGLVNNPSVLAKILDVVGFDGESATTNINGWQSITIPVPGTYLKINYLTGKTNYFDNQINGATANIQFKQDDETFNPFVATPPQTPVAELGQDTMGFMHRTANRTILIQFDSNTDAVIPIDCDDEFELAFASVTLIFRSSAPRIQLIFGNNAKITKNKNARSDKMNLSLGPGYGMWDNPHRHAVPFAYTSNGQNIVSGFQAIATTQAHLFRIFANRTPNAFPLIVNPEIGICTGWITNLTLSVCAKQGVTPTDQSFGTLFVFIQNTANLASNPLAPNIVHLICSLPWALGHMGGASPGNNSCNSVQNYSIPRRFSLRPGDNLDIIFKNQFSAGDMEYSFGIEGYVYGKIAHAGAAIPSIETITSTPLNMSFVVDALNTAPFPLDLLDDVN